MPHRRKTAHPPIRPPFSPALSASRAAALLLCLVFPVLPGCGKRPGYPLPRDGTSRFPTGVPLEEGDVILARSYGLIGAMFSTRSQEGGRYSHGAMIYRAGNGRLMVLNYRPTGMETCTPEEFFTRYARLALIRYRHGLDAAAAPSYAGNDGLRGKDALSAAARHWLARNAANRIPPDYRLNHDEHSSMFCLELTSAVYRDCGLPDPFNKAKKADSDPLLIKANRLFKADVIEIRSPSSALDNPDFVRIDAWERPEYDLRDEALNEELIRVVVDDIERDMSPRRPNILGRMKLRQIFAIYHVVTTLMVWRPRQDLPDFIDAEVIDNAYMLYSYMVLSKKAAKKRFLAETTPVYPDSPDKEEVMQAVRQIARESCDLYRGKYMRLETVGVNGSAPCGRRAFLKRCDRREAPALRPAASGNPFTAF